MIKFTITKAIILFLLSGILAACENDKWEFNFEKEKQEEKQKEKQEEKEKRTLPELEALTKAEFEQQVVGYGWKWIDTYEIKSDKKLADKPYWEGMEGASPKQYYFAKDSITSFVRVNAIPANCYWTTAYTYGENENQVTAVHGETSLQVFRLEDNKLEAIEYLGQRMEGIKIYGYSIYQRMSDEELEKCRKSYPTNFEDVWD